MALVLFRRYHTPEVATLPVVDGQLIWDIDTGDTYIDVGTKRIPTGGGSYKLPVASETVLGGVKSGGDILVDTETGIVTVKDDSHSHTIDNIKNLQNVLNLKASLDSPNFTGTPKINGTPIVSDSNYVHTDNNFTTLEKNKLSGIENNAQVNKIEDIKVNGISLAITNKSVSLTVPQKLSELTNDVGFVTNTVNNLTNYYLKSEINDMLSNLHTLDVQVVEQLPTQNISTTTIYLLPHTPTSENNYYDEYIYVNGKWELIGNTQVDFSGYLKSDGDGKDVTVTFTESTNTDSINSGESLAVMFGKIKKLFKRALPIGGTTGQILVKKSDTDFDAEWKNNTGELSLPDDLVYFEDGADINTNTGIIADDSLMLGGKPADYYDNNVKISDKDLVDIKYTHTYDYMDFNYKGNTLITKASLIFSTNSITTTGKDFSGFKVGDVVSITNCVVNASNNKVATITGVAAKVLTFANNTFIAGTETENATITKMPNEIANGNFANGTTGWTFSAASGSAANNELTFTASSRYGNCFRGVKSIANKKMYISSLINATSSNIKLAVQNNNTPFNVLGDVSHSNVAGYESLSKIVVCTENSSNYALKIVDHNASGWTAIKAKNVIVVDMGTDASNPLFNKTKEEMDALFANFTDETPASYSISVSPDNPQTIESVGEGNLFDKNNMEQGGAIFTIGKLYEDMKVANDTRIRSIKLINIHPSTKYTVSCPSGFYFSFQEYDVNKKSMSDSGWKSNIITLTTNANARYFVFFIRKSDSSNITPSECPDIQFNYGDIATPYIPYRSFNIQKSGKNLLCKCSPVTKSGGGITMTINDDNTFTLDGTASSQQDFYLYGYWNNPSYSLDAFLKKGIYTFSIPNSKNRIYAQSYMKLARMFHKYWDADFCNFTLDKDSFYGNLYITVKAGETFNNETFYPQLELGNTQTLYAPYQGTENIITLKDANGNYLEPLSKLPNGVKDEIFKDNDGLWKVRKNVEKLVCNETFNFSVGTPNHRFLIDLQNVGNEAISNIYKTNNTNDAYKTDRFLWVQKGTRINIYDYTYAGNIAGFKAQFKDNPLVIYYETTTPNTITLHQDVQTVLNNLSKPLDGETVLYGTNKINPTIDGVYNRGSKNSEMLGGKTASYYENKISILSDKIDNNTLVKPNINLGMNNVIHKTDNITSIPKFTIQGKSYVNLLGKDGNCEDVSKWNTYQSTLSLDNANKLFGSNGIKLTISSTYGSAYRDVDRPFRDASKYYFVSAYLKNGNLTNISIMKDATGGGVLKNSTGITDAQKFTRVGMSFQPSDINPSNTIVFQASGASGQYGYVDGIMVIEITEDEYYDLTTDQLMEKYPYIESYACLQNPYIEVKHDNLVRNGNGEEGVGWWIPHNTSTPLQLENGRFKILNVSQWTGCKQLVNVKKNTNYRIVGNLTGFSLAVYNISISTWLGNNGNYFNTGDNEEVIILIQNEQSSPITGYFDHIHLVEGTTAPTSYKPCRIERCIIEGKFTNDDSFTYENGEVSGLLNWKHKTLYGRDYDWQYSEDGAGFKSIAIGSPMSNISNSIPYPAVKYDRSMLKIKVCDYPGYIASANNIWVDGNNWVRITVSDSDTGWTETIAPNADEVKAFMNGWKTISTGQGRYTIFWNITTSGQNKSDFANNSCALSTVAYTSGQTALTVDDGSIFKAGDLFGVLGYTTPVTITSVNGNVLTIPNLGVSFPIGTRVVRCDNPSNGDLRNLTYCKSNIAPNYEGYQLHYKLANPEPITDVNTHIHGDIPKFDNSDNYLYLDYGYVLGEVANPSYDAGGWYNINLIGHSVVPDSELKNKAERIYYIYKNQTYDNWRWAWASDYWYYGKERIYTRDINYSLNATYTVDYQILKTLHTSPTSIQMSYQQDILNAISDLAESVNSRQKHDSTLDLLVDNSIFRTMTISGYWYKTNSAGFAVFEFSVYDMKTVPRVLIKNIWLDINGSTPSNFDLYNATVSKLSEGNAYIVRIVCRTTNSTTMTNISAYGLQSRCVVDLDCRGRI